MITTASIPASAVTGMETETKEAKARSSNPDDV